MITLTTEQVEKFEALFAELFPAAKNANIEAMITLGHYNASTEWRERRDELVTNIVAALWLILHPEDAEDASQ